ncbi:MAG TPA: cupin domain-containing protein [Vicinamibacteria bacterium]|jgi:uncharacterized cupin superfamily protein
MGWLVLLGALAGVDAPTSIIRFSPQGPPGVGLKGDEKSREHVYYTSAQDDQVQAGVWEAAPNTFGPHKAAYSEFMYLLEGSVTLVDKSGREETFRAGDAVLVPRGTEFTWKQTEKVRKYWVIFDRTGEAPKTAPTFIRVEADGPAPKGLSGEGRTKYHTYYETPDEKQSVGVWETKPHTGELHPTKYAELMVFLKGNVSLVDKNGREEKFQAGDVALVPKGIEYQWKGDTVRKFWVIFDPS